MTQIVIGVCLPNIARVAEIQFALKNFHASAKSSRRTIPRSRIRHKLQSRSNNIVREAAWQEINQGGDAVIIKWGEPCNCSV